MTLKGPTTFLVPLASQNMTLMHHGSTHHHTNLIAFHSLGAKGSRSPPKYHAHRRPLPDAAASGIRMRRRGDGTNGEKRVSASTLQVLAAITPRYDIHTSFWSEP